MDVAAYRASVGQFAAVLCKIPLVNLMGVPFI
jgi:hypothetical protein